MKEIKTLQAIDKSIAHWERMIEYVEARSLDKRKVHFALSDKSKGHFALSDKSKGHFAPSSLEMKIDIDEGLGPDDCALCCKFYDTVDCSCCEGCPLDDLGDTCGYSEDENGIYIKVTESSYCSDWLENVRDMMLLLLFAKEYVKMKEYD